MSIKHVTVFCVETVNFISTVNTKIGWLSTIPVCVCLCVYIINYIVLKSGVKDKFTH